MPINKKIRKLGVKTNVSKILIVWQIQAFLKKMTLGIRPKIIERAGCANISGCLVTTSWLSFRGTFANNNL